MNESAGAYKYSEEDIKSYHIYLPRKRAKLKRVHENHNSCPHCTGTTTYDQAHHETYCTICGLVTRASIEYTGLRRVYYPHGRQ